MTANSCSSHCRRITGVTDAAASVKHANVFMLYVALIQLMTCQIISLVRNIQQNMKNEGNNYENIGIL